MSEVNLLDKTINIKTGIPWQVQEERVIILSPAEHMAHELNEVGSEIWLGVHKELKVTEIITSLSKTFAAEESIIKADVLHFITTLESKNLLEVM